MHGTITKTQTPVKVIVLDDNPAGQSITSWMAQNFSYVSYAIYDLMVRTPLRKFYFQTVYDGKNPEDICAGLSGHPASFYTSTPENMAECQGRMDRLFQSWDSMAMFMIHFSLLAFVTIRIILCLTGGRSRHDGCHCNPCNHNNNGGTDRVISIDELRRFIESTSTPLAIRQVAPAPT